MKTDTIKEIENENKELATQISELQAELASVSAKIEDLKKYINKPELCSDFEELKSKKEEAEELQAKTDFLRAKLKKVQTPEDTSSIAREISRARNEAKDKFVTETNKHIDALRTLIGELEIRDNYLNNLYQARKDLVINRDQYPALQSLNTLCPEYNRTFNYIRQIDTYKQIAR